MSNTVESKKRGFFGFIIYFIVKIKEDDIFALGAQLAYYLILSFFPFLIIDRNAGAQGLNIKKEERTRE